eukprot:28186-Amorphochlora_amoeboformis.AAC.1
MYYDLDANSPHINYCILTCKKLNPIPAEILSQEDSLNNLYLSSPLMRARAFTLPFFFITSVIFQRCHQWGAPSVRNSGKYGTPCRHLVCVLRLTLNSSVSLRLRFTWAFGGIRRKKTAEVEGWAFARKGNRGNGFKR